MAPFIQYLRDTRAELKHVAWPSQSQTIVYALLVAVISIGAAAYLGLFDYAFTAGLTHFLENAPAQNPISVTQSTSTTPTITISTSSANTTK